MDEKVILLVEDNPDDVFLTQRALNKSHIANKLAVAENGQEALDYLFCQNNYSERDPKQIPEVVLLDLKLPRAGGLDVLKKIRANLATRMLPVVVLTSSSADKDVINSYQPGCNSFIRKPVVFDQLVKAVEQLGLYWLVLNQNSPQGEGCVPGG